LQEECTLTVPPQTTSERLKILHVAAFVVGNDFCFLKKENNQILRRSVPGTTQGGQ
jgi:hypothetical protein